MVKKQKQWCRTSSRIRWRHIAPLQINHVVLFSLIAFHVYPSLPQATPSTRVAKKAPTLLYLAGFFQSREQLWRPEACTPHSASPQPAVTQQLRDRPLWASARLTLCTPGSCWSKFSFPSYIVWPLRRDLVNAIFFIFPCDGLVILTQSSPQFLIKGSWGSVSKG